jgi:hypothetical protein
LQAELLEGVAQGERVIVHPDREIEDGTHVSLRD